MKFYFQSLGVVLYALLLIPFSVSADTGRNVRISGKNTQTVVVSGSVVNSATDGATARVNIGSVVGADIGGDNKQTVVVNGSIVNSASGRGSKSEINIGSVTR